MCLFFSVCRHAGLITDLVPMCLVFQSVSTQVYGFGFSVPSFSLCQHAVTIIDLVSTCLFFFFFFLNLIYFVSMYADRSGYNVPWFFSLSACRDNYRSRFNMPSFSLCQHAGIIINLVSTCLVFQSVSMQAYRQRWNMPNILVFQHAGI